MKIPKVFDGGGYDEGYAYVKVMVLVRGLNETLVIIARRWSFLVWHV